MLVDHFLTGAARRRPDAVALVCGTRRLAYRQLDEAAAHVASGLRELGVGRGDRVVIHLENSVEAVLAIFGALKAGAAFVPVGPTVKADKLAYILEDCQATALIGDERARQVYSSALPGRSSVKAVAIAGGSVAPSAASDDEQCALVSFEALADGEVAPARTDPQTRIDLDLAALIYTSGSTGRPKGVALTHSNMVAAATSISDYLENTESDVILDVLPLSFDYGLYQVFLASKAVARLVLERSFVYPTAVLDLLRREQVTGLPIVPMLGALLLKHDLRAYGESLRYITNTGAPLPPAHVKALRERLPSVRIFSMYGLTECKRVSFLSPGEIDARPGSVGKPMGNVEVFVADQSGRLSPTGTGELVVRGANVMQGYWRSPELTAQILKPGPLPGENLLYTGDIFHIDDDGYMYFQGRGDDMIKSRGQRVSPKEVENVIYELTGVVGAAVVGVPDALVGSHVKAFVRLQPGVALTEQDVLRHCAQRLEDFMVPRTVAFVSDLPVTESGKIDRRRLAAESAPVVVSGT